MAEICDEPQEFFLKIEGHDHLLGRILVHGSQEIGFGEAFNAEVGFINPRSYEYRCLSFLVRF